MKRRQLIAHAVGAGLVCALPPGSVRAHGQTVATRIVTIGADVTETVFALGMGDHIVGSDTTSTWPRAAIQTPKVGYMRNLSAEGLLSLKPDLILATGAAGPKSTLDQLRAAGAHLVQTPDDYTLAAAREKILRIGDAVGAQANAQDMVVQFDRDALELKELTDSFVDSPRLVFLLSVGRGAPQASGRKTAADAVIKLIGANNLFSHPGYKAVSVEALAQAAPDLILLMPHTLHSAGGVRDVSQLPGISLTPAGKNGRIMAMDATALMTFGPRAPRAALALARDIRAMLA